MKFLMPRLLVMLLCFTIDVQVKASKEKNDNKNHDLVLEVGANDKVENKGKSSPANKLKSNASDFFSQDRVIESVYNCLSKTKPNCAVKVVRGPFLYVDSEGKKWTFAGKSVFKLENGGEVNLLKGAAQVTYSGLWKLQFGASPVVFKGGKGEAILEKKGRTLKLYNIFGHIKIFREKAANVDSFENLPEGFQVFVDGVGVDGTLRVGIPEPFYSQDFLATWAKFAVDEREFFEKVRELKPKWRLAVESASDWYRHSAERTIAIAEDKNKKRKAWLKAKLQEESRLRELFRSKTGY